MSDHLIDLNYTVYMFHHDSTHHRSHGARLRNLPSMGRLSPSSGIEIPTSTKWSNAGAEYAVGPSGVFITMEQVGPWSLKGHHLCSSADVIVFVMTVN